jgi:heme exporter protein C
MAQRNPSLPDPGLPRSLSATRPTNVTPVRLLGLAWLAVTLVVMAVGFRQAIFIAPTEATMGNVQRIFYYHVPHAIWALIFPYLNLAGSVAFLYLRRRNPLAGLNADALAVAAAEVTVVYATVGLATGMLWGRVAWGIWWTWDARLTTFLLLWLLYVAYLMTRRLSKTGQTSTLGAVLAVFAAIDVPIVYYSIQWWRTQHPAPVLTGDGELDPTMKVAFLWNLLGWGMWGLFLVGVRYGLERRRQRAEQEATLSQIEATLHDVDMNVDGQQGANNAY